MNALLGFSEAHWDHSGHCIHIVDDGIADGSPFMFQFMAQYCQNGGSVQLLSFIHDDIHYQQILKRMGVSSTKLQAVQIHNGLKASLCDADAFTEYSQTISRGLANTTQPCLLVLDGLSEWVSTLSVDNLTPLLGHVASLLRLAKSSPSHGLVVHTRFPQLEEDQDYHDDGCFKVATIVSRSTSRRLEVRSIASGESKQLNGRVRVFTTDCNWNEALFRVEDGGVELIAKGLAKGHV
eukprot:m.137762 g.137762  ORF g.137762 m.137762 type:complete len:237 (+) comp16060_c0_seq2:126-836(+)